MRRIAVLVLALVLFATAAPLRASPFTDAVGALIDAITARTSAIDAGAPTGPLKKERKHLAAAAEVLGGLGELDPEADAPGIGAAGKSLGKSKTSDAGVLDAAATLVDVLASAVQEIITTETDRFHSLVSDADRRTARIRLAQAEALLAAAYEVLAEDGADAALARLGKAAAKLGAALDAADGPAFPEVEAPLAALRQPGTRGTTFLWNTTTEQDPQTFTVESVQLDVVIYSYGTNSVIPLSISQSKLASQSFLNLPSPTLGPGGTYDLFIEALRERAMKLAKGPGTSYKGMSGIALITVSGREPFVIRISAL
ncbi:MAG: hypothetical protein HMLKMBBP_03460 [Planctomycetes bacterium]|nr:hypothetical protein [Planctomycetota bacterium]